MPREIPVRRTTLADQGRTDHLLRLTPSERIAMMWQLALQAWMFKEGLAEALVIPVIGREDFITNKKASGRPKDLSDLTLLPPA